MYWRDYDITYQAYDVDWAGLRVSSDGPQPSITSDIFYVKASTLEVISVGISKSVYIEAPTKTTANIYPVLTDLLTTNLYCENSLTPVVNAFYSSLDVFAGDVLYPTVLNASTIYLLYETLIKHLTDTGWKKTAIYMKESDRNWHSKPIYMKQMDKSWI